MTSDLDEIMAFLLDCETPLTLRETWLSLSDAERAALRWSPVLGRHAERVLRGEQ